MGAAWVARGRRKDELIRRGARRRRVRCAATLAIRSRGRVKRRRAALGCDRGLGLFGFPYFSLQVRAGGNPGIYAGQRPTQAHL